MIGHFRPAISAVVAAFVWLAGAHSLLAQTPLAPPADSLRIIANRDVLIFGPREQFTFDLEPLLAGVEPSTTIDIATTLTPARGRTTLWSTQQRLPVPVQGPATATLHVPMPAQEGVYEIRLAVTRPPGFRERFFPGGGGAPLVERSFQVVVLDRLPKPPAPDAEWRSVQDIDPANPAWSTRVPDWTQLRRLPGMPRRPINSLRASTVSLPSGVFVELPPTPPQGGPHWQAYPLAIDALGAPHLIEVEYPNDGDQHLGISIVEPDAQGRFVTIGRDSGVYVEGLGAAERTGRGTHRIVFWPRTNSPLVLITNQHPTAAAHFGRIHVKRRSASTIAVEPWSETPPVGRLVAAYLSRPAVSSSLVDDWQSFYDGTTHLAEYLNYAGYNSAVVNATETRAQLLPSRVLESQRSNDIGPITADADLPTPDGLELGLRLFDRAGLALIPTLDLTMPLPELERLRQQAGAQSGGIELVGPDGRTWLETHPAEQGAAHYNLLDPRVQQALVNVTVETMRRYGRHPSFRSLGVQLSARGYGALPGLEWGLDDTTIARFEQEAGVQLQSFGTDRFAARHQQLTGQYADQWRAWRAAQITSFYTRMAEVVASAGGDRTLILTTENLLGGGIAAGKLRPNVVAKPRLDRAMLELGIDWQSLGSTPGIVVVPTRYVESMVPLVDRALDLSINDGFLALESPLPAAMFYHRPHRQSYASFDALGPFAAQARLATQSAADGAAARRPYVDALVASDPMLIVDGGEAVPLGQEEAVRHVRAILKALPASPAVDVRREQNVTVRTYEENGETICVVMNECPWRADVALDVVAESPTDAVRLIASDKGPATEHFQAGHQVWSLQLAPFDVHAVRFPASALAIDGIQSQISEAGRQELAGRLKELKDRDLTATPSYAALRNPSFEAIGGAERIPGWQLQGDPQQVAADLDLRMPQDGKSSLYLRNTGQGTATIESEPFATPPTGQLVMRVFVRGENVGPDSQVRLVFETDGQTEPIRQVATLGGRRAQPLNRQWGLGGYAFPVLDLPLDSRGTMRVKFELVGPGEVWIDNVQLHDVLFPLPFYERSELEKLELVKLITATDNALTNGQYAECARKLEGYWPRFLTAYSPAAVQSIATQPAAEPTPAPSAEQPPPVDTPRVGNRWFEFWKR